MRKRGALFLLVQVKAGVRFRDFSLRVMESMNLPEWMWDPNVSAGLPVWHTVAIPCCGAYQQQSNFCKDGRTLSCAEQLRFFFPGHLCEVQRRKTSRVISLLSMSI